MGQILPANINKFFHWYKHDYEMAILYNKVLYINISSFNCVKNTNEQYFYSIY